MFRDTILEENCLKELDIIIKNYEQLSSFPFRFRGSEIIEILEKDLKQQGLRDLTIKRINSLYNFSKATNQNPNTISSSMPIYQARDELFKESVIVIARLLNKRNATSDDQKIGRDIGTITEILDLTTEIIKDPIESSKNGKIFTLKKLANQTVGKPDYVNLILGLAACLAGAVLMGLSLAGAAHTAGFSLFGLYVGKGWIATGSGLLAASGIAFFKARGLHHSVSKRAMDVAEAADNIVASNNRNKSAEEVSFDKDPIKVEIPIKKTN